MSSRWGFEEDGDDLDPGSLDEPAQRADEPVQGSDPNRLATVTVTDDAKPVTVALASDWKAVSQPSALGTAVIAAMSAATSMAMVEQAKRLNDGDDSSGTLAPSTTSQSSPVETPLTKEDVVRLLDVVTEDLDRYMQQVKDIADRRVTVESGGGHVRVSGQARRIHELTIDPAWAGSVRTSEIESELLDALRRFDDAANVDALAEGPTSSALDELMAGAGDPRALIRRISHGHSP